MYQVQKRNGKNVEFDLKKISDAIKMAFEAQEKQYNPSIIDFIALKVTADFEPKIKEGLIQVEDIQDSVESVLVQAGYSDVAVSFKIGKPYAATSSLSSFSAESSSTLSASAGV